MYLIQFILLPFFFLSFLFVISYFRNWIYRNFSALRQQEIIVQIVFVNRASFAVLNQRKKNETEKIVIETATKQALQVVCIVSFDVDIKFTKKMFGNNIPLALKSRNGLFAQRIYAQIYMRTESCCRCCCCCLRSPEVRMRAETVYNSALNIGPSKADGWCFVGCCCCRCCCSGGGGHAAMGWAPSKHMKTMQDSRSNNNSRCTVRWQ